MVQWGDKLFEGPLLFALHIFESSFIPGPGCRARFYTGNTSVPVLHCRYHRYVVFLEIYT